MTIYEPNRDVGPVGVEFEEFADVPLLEDDRRTPPPDPARQTETGLPNHVYDLVLLLQQAAADVVRYRAFADDARAAGDDELAQWCEELADSDREIVTRAKAMLAVRLRA
jgi:hypothetical protein